MTDSISDGQLTVVSSLTDESEDTKTEDGRQ